MEKTILDFDSCPHCGSDYGYFEKVKFSGESEYNYGFQGIEVDNSELHNALKYRSFGAFYACVDCKKNICKRTKDTTYGK